MWILIILSGRVYGQELTFVFTGPVGPVTAGTRTNVSLNVLNPSLRELTWAFPKSIGARLVTPERSFDSTLELRDATGPGEVAITPGGFARTEYWWEVPASITGKVVIEFAGIRAGNLVVEVQLPASELKKEEDRSFWTLLKRSEPTGKFRTFQPGRFFQEHISGYEPFYFIAGTESPNAKFQFSFKYQVLNRDGPWAQNVPVLRGFHFAYTQTSLWDWNQASAPFLDSSYKPEILYCWDKIIGGGLTNWFRLDLQPGFQHESNGRAGDDSRSLNIVYLRPTLTFGRPEGFQLALQPRAWVYLFDLSDNPDLGHYRGNVDLRTVIGWQRGVQLSALGRLGNSANRGSLQVDLTYPLMSFFSGNFSIYLDAQYFTGYGESLLLYDQRSSAFRIGFALYR